VTRVSGSAGPESGLQATAKWQSRPYGTSNLAELSHALGQSTACGWRLRPVVPTLALRTAASQEWLLCLGGLSLTPRIDQKWIDRYEAAGGGIRGPDSIRGLSPSQRDVLRACATYQAGPKEPASPSIPAIGEVVGRTATSVAKTVKRLQQLGLLGTPKAAPAISTHAAVIAESTNGEFANLKPRKPVP
jgi:hypothetical protein